MFAEAAYLVGQALGYMHVGQGARPETFERVFQQVPRTVRRMRRDPPPTQPPRVLDREQAIERAGRLVGRAFQLYMQGGLTQAQAASRISNLATTFGTLE